MDIIEKQKSDFILPEEIQRCYEETFDLSEFQGFKYAFSDPYYKPCDIEAMASVLYSDQIQNQKYELHLFDCDDFTFALMGAFHHDRVCAAMPIFITRIRRPSGVEHGLITFYYQKKIVAIEAVSDAAYWTPRNWKLQLLLG